MNVADGKKRSLPGLGTTSELGNDSREKRDLADRPKTSPSEAHSRSSHSGGTISALPLDVLEKIVKIDYEKNHALTLRAVNGQLLEATRLALPKLESEIKNKAFSARLRGAPLTPQLAHSMQFATEIRLNEATKKGDATRHIWNPYLVSGFEGEKTAEESILGQLALLMKDISSLEKIDITINYADLLVPFFPHAKTVLESLCDGLERQSGLSEFKFCTKTLYGISPEVGRRLVESLAKSTVLKKCSFDRGTFSVVIRWLDNLTHLEDLEVSLAVSAEDSRLVSEKLKALPSLKKVKTLRLSNHKDDLRGGFDILLDPDLIKMFKNLEVDYDKYAEESLDLERRGLTLPFPKNLNFPVLGFESISWVAREPSEMPKVIEDLVLRCPDLKVLDLKLRGGQTWRKRSSFLTNVAKKCPKLEVFKWQDECSSWQDGRLTWSKSGNLLGFFAGAQNLKQIKLSLDAHEVAYDEHSFSRLMNSLGSLNRLESLELELEGFPAVSPEVAEALRQGSLFRQVKDLSLRVDPSDPVRSDMFTGFKYDFSNLLSVFDAKTIIKFELSHHSSQYLLERLMPMPQLRSLVVDAFFDRSGLALIGAKYPALESLSIVPFLMAERKRQQRSVVHDENRPNDSEVIDIGISELSLRMGGAAGRFYIDYEIVVPEGVTFSQLSSLVLRPRALHYSMGVGQLQSCIVKFLKNIVKNTPNLETINFSEFFKFRDEFESTGEVVKSVIKELDRNIRVVSNF